MTIRLPPDKKPGILDKVLKLLGKERALLLPHGIKINPYDIITIKYESFWKCLFRSKSADKELKAKALAEAQAEVEKRMADPNGKKNLS